MLLKFPTCWPAVCLFFLLLSASSSSQAQRYSFKSYSQDEGLSNLSITCMLQDHNRLIWVGTQNGLFWYDGRVFREFAPGEFTGSTTIEALAEGPDGTLWIATHRALLRRNGMHVQPIDLKEPVEIVNANTLLPFKKMLYVSTRQGLVELDTSTLDGRPQMRWLSRTPAISVAEDSRGRIWFGCDNSLCRINDGQIIDVMSKYRLPHQHW